MKQLEILYRDEHFIAVDKPSGMLVHRSPFERRAAFALQTTRDQIGQRVYPVHRLDRPTSGLLLFALSPEAAARGCLVFREKRIEKTYLAVVRGYTSPEGRIDYPLSPEKDAPRKEAQTRYRQLATVEIPVPLGRYETTRYSLVKVRPETGRLHQIRKHFAHIFHPVVGDTVHGDGLHNRFFRDRFGLHRLLLCATGIRFTHPFTETPVHIEASPAADLRRLLSQLGWERHLRQFAPAPLAN